MDQFRVLLAGLLEMDVAGLSPETRLSTLKDWDSMSRVLFVAMVDAEYHRQVSGQDVATAEDEGDGLGLDVGWEAVGRRGGVVDEREVGAVAKSVLSLPPPRPTPDSLTQTNLHPRSAVAAMSSGWTPSSSKAATDMGAGIWTATKKKKTSRPRPSKKNKSV